MSNVSSNQQEIQGQGETVKVNEFSFVADTPILDPNSPLAVQVPEHEDAHLTLANALRQGTVEEQLASTEDEPAAEEEQDVPEDSSTEDDVQD